MRATQSEAIDKIAAALAKAQAEIRTATKDGENPHFKSTFTTLASVLDAVREPLSKNNISFTQAPQQSADGHYLETTLAHASGQWFKSYHPLHPIKNDPQSVGSAITYARRYALCAMVGVVGRDEDDDGEAAHGRGPVNREEPAQRQQQSKPPASKPATKPQEKSEPVLLGFDRLKALMETASSMDELKAAGDKTSKESKAVQEKLRPIYMAERKRLQAPAKPQADEPAGDEVAV